MRIGALISRSGPAGLWGPSTEACAMLAAGELKEAGHAVDLVIADPGWTEAEAEAAAADMLDLHAVDAIVGMHPSNVRHIVKAQIGSRVPYYYTPQYEGGEAAPSTIALGGTDGLLMRPTLPWFTRRKARRFCLVANDYVWPQKAMETATALVGEAGGWIAGRIVAPFDGDYEEALDSIRRIRPDVVVMLLLGEEMVRFNRAFAAAGLHGSILRFGLGIDEHVLMGIGPDATGGLYAATTFIAEERTRQAEWLVELYRDCFGEHAPSLTVYGQSCYEGMHMAAEMARLCRSTRGPDMARFIAGLRRETIRPMLPRAQFRERHSLHFVEADGIGWRSVPVN